MSNFLKIQWDKYKTRKTKLGIISDFILLALLIGLFTPATRIHIQSFVVGLTMRSPKETGKGIKLTEKDYDWRYMDSEGQTKQFDDLKNKVVFLNLWATWCGPCVAEFPAINDLYKEYGDRVEFILLSNEDLETIHNFLKKKNFEIPSYRYFDELPQVLQSQSIPTTYVISKSGELVIEKKGAANWNGDTFKSVLDKLIAE